MTFRGDDILGGIQVIADAHGNVKGKVGNPDADPPSGQTANSTSGPLSEEVRSVLNMLITAQSD